MRDQWRLIYEDSDDPVFHLSSIEALWRSLDEGFAPETLLLRRLSPCVLIGCSQDAKREVDLAACQKRGIKVLRRPSEGGAIYCDRNCLLFSIVCRRCNDDYRSESNNKNAPYDHAMVSWANVIAKALQRLGIPDEACFSGPNDILVAGKKVAGLTLTDWYGIRSFSGAILIEADFATIDAVLTPDRQKCERHNLAKPSERVTSLSRVLSRPVNPNEISQALITTIENELNVSFQLESWTNQEMDAINLLRNKKYGNPSWNLAQNFEEAAS